MLNPTEVRKNMWEIRGEIHYFPPPQKKKNPGFRSGNFR
jgi:hypothetical protein